MLKRKIVLPMKAKHSIRKSKNPDVTSKATYRDERIIFFDNLHHMRCNARTRVESHIVVLCLKGKASLFVNDQNYELQANEILITHPNITLESSMVSRDFKCRCICLAPEYIKELFSITSDNWDIRLFLEKNPVVAITPEEKKLFCRYYDLLNMKLTGSKLLCRKETIDALLKAFLYEFSDILLRFMSWRPASFSSGEKLFKMFIEELTSTYPKERGVSYYADRLYVTPKYLTSVCNEVAGHPTSFLIDQYVMKDINYLLCKTKKSVKEIANELHFTNVSFFGKYVKKHFGFSPREIRRKLEEEGNESV